jgi:hypothetical protein
VLSVGNNTGAPSRERGKPRRWRSANVLVPKAVTLHSPSKWLKALTRTEPVTGLSANTRS